MRYQLDSPGGRREWEAMYSRSEVNAGSSSGRTLDFESGYGRSNRSPAASSLKISKFPLRPMAGRRALNAEIVVRVYGREPELWSIGRMADCLSAGTGSISR